MCCRFIFRILNNTEYMLLLNFSYLQTTVYSYCFYQPVLSYMRLLPIIWIWCERIDMVLLAVMKQTNVKLFLLVIQIALNYREERQP